MKINLLDKVLELAKKEIGYVEKPVNLTKYGEWADKNKFSSMKLNGQPWCYTFVSWCLMFAGCKEPFFAYVPAGYDHYRKTGKIFKDPKIGDLIFFDFNKDGIPEHIGFCIGINYNRNKVESVITIEGNTSSGQNGSQDNGEGVHQRLRHISLIKAFGRPDYGIIEINEPVKEVKKVVKNDTINVKIATDNRKGSKNDNKSK